MSVKSNLITEDLDTLQKYQEGQSESTARDTAAFVGLCKAIVGVLDYFEADYAVPPEIKRLERAAKKLLIVEVK